MKNKINVMLVGIAILVIIATVAGTTIVYYNLFQSQIKSDLAVSAKLLKDTHYFESANIDTEDIDLSTDIDELRVTWIGEDGTVLYDNDAKTEKLVNHKDRPEIHDAFADGVGESVRQSDTMKENTFYYAVLLDNNTVLRVATDAKSIWSVFMSVAPVVGLILLFIIVACVGISHVLTRQMIKPIEIMAKNLEDTDYSSPYKELDPFMQTIRMQHADILSAAKARQDFTANVSHELKTPLTAISGYAELLEEDMVEESQKKQFYRKIRENTNRLLALINDIIGLSELDRKDNTYSFDEVDLYETVAESAESLAVTASQKGIKFNFDGEPCCIRGNKDMLKELVENLAQNAILYNSPGGSVSVSVKKSEGRASLTVSDTGIGIPAAEQQRIFERFYRVDKSRSKATGGTGLGLAIVKHIVEIHDAAIELDSTPDVGTTVKVQF